MVKKFSATFIILSLLIVVFLSLIYRLYDLQFRRVERYRQKADRQQSLTVVTQPRRGIILDRKGRVLAASNKIESVFADPSMLLDIDLIEKVASELQTTEMLDMSMDDICYTILNSRNLRFVYLRKNITAKQVANGQVVGADSCRCRNCYQLRQ